MNYEGYTLLPPEEVVFSSKTTYYVKLLKRSGIQPYRCIVGRDGGTIRMGSAINARRRGTEIWNQGYVGKVTLDTDIEFVIMGGDQKRLQRAYQERLFGRRDVASVETGRRADAPVQKRTRSKEGQAG